MIEATTFWELVQRRAALTPDAMLGLDESLKTMTFEEFSQRMRERGFIYAA